ncbi:hypothetical protein jhhlp_007698 [Lomentospora prolificans]|uniref:Uncharacterized protein n=1 Tax=Lomentospora prolificans TaxID=41688 RepID=A0A2N3N0B4_9PEZI|nr:hypothetical protein jhhlp_007698 [Lomentospora prolificans]
MATEATLEKSADAPASTNSQSTSDREPYGQDVFQKPSLNSGLASDDIENKHITGIDEQPHSTDVSVSGGSDSEAYKAYPSTSLNDDKGHTRTSSAIRKPATFKAVSVNKTFLASKAGVPAAAAKPGEKSAGVPGTSSSPLGSSNLLSNRPRLVAKTGSGSRDSAPRFTANGGKPGAAPDATSVWNKNRPTPTPEPKKLSDEELKKYGIHMANRLHSEDIKGQSNWADIDDDDEDWAPESLTWTDGTKITLPAPDEAPSNPVEPAQPATAPVVKDKSAVAQTKSAVPSRTSSPSTKSSGLASGKGLILKAGSTDKVTLVTKPAAPPPPAKSPWAPLPPIQKASPAVDPSVAHTSPRPSFKEPHLHKQFQHSSGREIAADDFSRSSWREHPNTLGRELYNSQSGRYEPVQDRRGSFRSDTYSRPALLQRPHPHHDSTEPSPTFQTARPAQDVPFGRRRGSSNVSGGSGLLQRAGKAYEPGSMQPPDILSTRRGSFTASTDSHVSPRNFSPSAQPGGRLSSAHGWPPRSSPSSAYATPHYAHAHSEKQAIQSGQASENPVQSEEEAVEFQKRLMRERREEAIRRRLEEEAREEAAKAERIRLKLEAMGPPPERKSAKKDQGDKANADTPSTPTASQGTTPLVNEMAAAMQDRGDNLQQGHDTKIGHPLSAPTSPSGPKSELSSNPQSQPRHARQTGVNQANLWNSSGQPSSSRLTSWPSSGQQSSRNVWGSPNNDRGLGNGTFNPDLGRVPESRPTQLSQPQANEPTPIGPPGGRILNRNQPPAATQAYPASRPDRFTASEGRPYNEKQNQWVQSVLQVDASLRDQRAKERAEFDQRLADQGLTCDDAQPAIKQAWRPDSGSSRADQGSRAGPPPSWTRTLDEGRKHNSSNSADNLANGAIRGTSASSILPSSAPSNSAAQTRASRFFPPKEKDARPNTNSSSEGGRAQSPSPPPPTMDDHPVYDGDASHPHVSLPRPQPVVRLPPTPSASTHSQNRKIDPTWPSSSNPRSLYISPASANAGHHSSATIQSAPQSQQEWQEKIYELTGRRATPRSPAVESASRSMLDHSFNHNPATVSLPNHIASKGIGNGGVTSKPMAEECFEEQEMGSLPPIRIPHKAPDAAWQPAAPASKPLPRTFMVVATTTKLYDLSDNGGSGLVRIAFPNTEPKTISLQSAGGRGSGRGAAHGRPSGRNRAPGSNNRSGASGKRDASNTFANEPAGNTQGPPSSLGSRGRGSYRSRSGETWSRRPAHPASG